MQKIELKITDIDGEVLTVTDLDEALRQAAEFMEYRHDPPIPEIDERLVRYWTDLYGKLTALHTGLKSRDT